MSGGGKVRCKEGEGNAWGHVENVDLRIVEACGRNLCLHLGGQTGRNLRLLDWDAGGRNLRGSAGSFFAFKDQTFLCI